jgi:hypothetical protein
VTSQASGTTLPLTEERSTRSGSADQSEYVPACNVIGAWLAKPAGASRGGIVVVQEIFGVNAHVRSVCRRFAALGYTAIAPAFFDHVETGVELGYDDDGFKRGRALVGQISFDRAIEDVAAPPNRSRRPAALASSVTAGAARSPCSRQRAWRCRR